MRAGDLLIRLDETVVRANLTAIDKSLMELMGRQARGEAERDGAAAVVFPDGLKEAEAAEVVRGESVLFASRRTARELRCELHALGFAAGERGRRLPHLDVAESDVAYRPKFVVNSRNR